MRTLKRLLTRLEDIMTAAAFAEAGDTKTAVALLKEDNDTGCLRQRKYARKTIALNPSHS